MPKNFSEINSKAVATSIRRATVKKEKEQQNITNIEDMFWKDDNKNVMKKQKRKGERKEKKQATLTKKAENKAMLEKEMAGLTTKIPTKITRAQTTAAAINNKTINKEKTSRLDTKALIENINKLSISEQEARSVTDAIKILEWKPEEIDKHPEKRLKAAFTSYEQTRLPILKKIHPSLRLSQLKQIIFKEWQKAAENPLNKGI